MGSNISVLLNYYDDAKEEQINEYINSAKIGNVAILCARIESGQNISAKDVSSSPKRASRPLTSEIRALA